MLASNQSNNSKTIKRPQGNQRKARLPRKPLTLQPQLQSQITRRLIQSGPIWRKIWLAKNVIGSSLHHIIAVTPNLFRTWHPTTIRIWLTCSMSKSKNWKGGEETITWRRLSPRISRYLTKTVSHPIGSSRIFSLALLTNVRLKESQNSRNFSSKESNLLYGWTQSVSQTLSVRVIQRTLCDLIVKMGITFSFLSTKSPRLTRSYSIQMLRSSLLRYWTRSAGVESVARPTIKSNRSVDRGTWSFYVVCTSRIWHCCVRKNINLLSTITRNCLTSRVWHARGMKGMS